MRKILGTPDQYYKQTDNAQVELFKDYFHNSKAIACGPTSAAMCLATAGWPLNVFTPGEQVEDSILMVLHNPQNLKKYIERRNVNYDQYPPNEIPQTYEVAMQIIYGKPVCAWIAGLDFHIVKRTIDSGKPMMICGQFPAGAHYVAVVGYDEEKPAVIFNDPYPVQWSDKNGFNREMAIDFFTTQIQRHRVEFNKYEK